MRSLLVNYWVNQEGLESVADEILLDETFHFHSWKYQRKIL